jgi:hypothetical protein
MSLVHVPQRAMQFVGTIQSPLQSAQFPSFALHHSSVPPPQSLLFQLQQKLPVPVGVTGGAVTGDVEGCSVTGREGGVGGAVTGALEGCSGGAVTGAVVG